MEIYFSMIMNNITLETNPVIFIMMQYHDYFKQMKIQYAIKILFIYFNSFLRIASFYSIPLISHSIENLPPILTHQGFIALSFILTYEYNLNFFTLQFSSYKTNR